MRSVLRCGLAATQCPALLLLSVSSPQEILPAAVVERLHLVSACWVFEEARRARRWRLGAGRRCCGWSGGRGGAGAGRGGRPTRLGDGPAHLRRCEPRVLHTRLRAQRDLRRQRTAQLRHEYPTCRVATGAVGRSSCCFPRRSHPRCARGPVCPARPCTARAHRRTPSQSRPCPVRIRCDAFRLLCSVLFPPINGGFDGRVFPARQWRLGARHGGYSRSVRASRASRGCWQP